MSPAAVLLVEGIGHAPAARLLLVQLLHGQRKLAAADSCLAGLEGVAAPAHLPAKDYCQDPCSNSGMYGAHMTAASIGILFKT